MQPIQNNSFFYRETPVDYDGTGTLTDIKGNTVVFNQLVQNGNFADTSSWSGTRGNISVSSNVATYTITTIGSNEVQNRIGQTLSQPLISGHKYMLKYSYYPKYNSKIIVLLAVNNSSPSINLFTLSNLVANSWNDIKGIFTADNPYNSLWLGVGANTNYSVNDTVQYKNAILFDLTIMGIDNLTTTAEVEAWLSSHIGNLPYYDYTTGKLLPFKGESLKTTGKNLNNSFLKNTSAIYSDGRIDYSNTDTFRCAMYDYVTLPSGTYVISTPSTGLQSDCNIYDLDGTFIKKYYNEWKNFPYPITLEKPSKIKVYCRKSDNSVFTASDYSVQVEFGSTATEYEPYTTDTLSLPINDYFPTGLKAVPNGNGGFVFDELLENEAITRIKSIKLGSLNWGRYQQGSYYYFGSNELTDKARNWNFICSKYVNVRGGRDILVDKSIGTNNPTSSINYLAVRDDSFTDVLTFKQAMIDEDVELFYELATPTVVTIDPPLDLTYSIWDDGTEQLLPENSSSPSTTPILCDIDYRTMIPVNAEDDPDGAGVITGTGNYRYHSIATLEATPTDEIYRFLRWEDENGDTVATTSSYSFKVGE